MDDSGGVGPARPVHRRRPGGGSGVLYLYRARHGRNYEVAARVPAEPDIYGLNVTKCSCRFTTSHRLFRSTARAVRRAAAPPTGEAPAVAFGALASLGFLYLIGRFCGGDRIGTSGARASPIYRRFRRARDGRRPRLQIAYHVSPLIRCYNRLSIFIAFFALGAVFLLLQRLAGARQGGVRRGRRRRPRRPARTRSFDQFSSFFVPQYTPARVEYGSDWGIRPADEGAAGPVPWSPKCLALFTRKARPSRASVLMTAAAVPAHADAALERRGRPGPRPPHAGRPGDATLAGGGGGNRLRRLPRRLPRPRRLRRRRRPGRGRTVAPAERPAPGQRPRPANVL